MKIRARNLVILCVVLIAAAILMGVIYRVSTPGTQTGLKTIAVLVDIDGEKTEFPVYTQQEYLGPALVDAGLVDGDSGEMGLFITSVNGVPADAARQQWWCITKGGADVHTGVDYTPIADGDSFEITLKTGY